MDPVASALAALRPENLFPTWCYVDRLEQLGDLDAGETRRWKHAIFGLMVLWGLEPDDVLELRGRLVEEPN